MFKNIRIKDFQETQYTKSLNFCLKSPHFNFLDRKILVVLKNDVKSLVSNRLLNYYIFVAKNTKFYKKALRSKIFPLSSVVQGILTKLHLLAQVFLLHCI